MKILLIDTCGVVGSVALADTDRAAAIVASEALPGRSASERLVAVIREMTMRSGIGLGSLDAVAVVNGPGSFTGVRVGLSAAKGLCEALSLPLIAISRLALLAHRAAPAAGIAVSALDAGRGEFYVGEYAASGCGREALLSREALLAMFGRDAADRVLFTCEEAVAKALEEMSPRKVSEPLAADALPLALARVDAAEWDDLATLDANYLRRSDAEIFAKPAARKAAGIVSL